MARRGRQVKSLRTVSQRRKAIEGTRIYVVVFGGSRPVPSPPLPSPLPRFPASVPVDGYPPCAQLERLES